jgi:hypothetical protein
MSAAEIITEIQRLPESEQEKVVRFATALAEERELSGDELDVLVERLLETTDPTAKAVLRESIVRGFYGGAPAA